MQDFAVVMQGFAGFMLQLCCCDAIETVQAHLGSQSWF